MTVAFVVAVAVLLGLLLFLVRVVQPRRVGILLSAVVLLLAFVAFWGFIVEPNRLVVHEETIEIENWPRALDGLKIAVLSDIHAGGSFIDDKKLRLIVERTNQLIPSSS